MAINYFLSLEDIRRLDTYQTTNLKFRPRDAIANQDYFHGCKVYAPKCDSVSQSHLDLLDLIMPQSRTYFLTSCIRDE